MFIWNVVTKQARQGEKPGGSHGFFSKENVGSGYMCAIQGQMCGLESPTWDFGQVTYPSVLCFSCL